MSLNVDDIATDGDLENAMASAEQLNSAQPLLAKRNADRAQALADCLEALGGRSPPIYSNTLSVPTELKSAVVYRALTLICRKARNVAGDTWDVLQADFDREYSRAIKRSFTVSTGVRGPSGGSVALERR